MVAHNAPFDRRVLRQAFERIGLDWPQPPVLCTAALSRTLLPLQRRRGLRAVADALGIDVDVVHRALADAETCARVLCALFPRLCANALTIRDAVSMLAPRRRRRAKPPSIRVAAAPAFPKLPQLDFAKLPRDPGVYLFRDGSGQTLYVGKSVSIRSRARAHFAPSSPQADWTAHAEIVDYRTTNSELGALVLENRLIKELRPPGNSRLVRGDDRLCYIRCRLDIPFPILEVSLRAGAGTRGHGRSVARPAARARARRAAGLAVRPAPLRTQAPAPRAPVGLRADGSLPVAVPGRPGPEPVPPAAGRGAADVRRRRRRPLPADRPRRGSDAPRSCGAAVRARRLAAAPRSAAVGDPRPARRRARGHPRAASRLVLAAHPVACSLDAFWLVAGRLVDWGPVGERADPADLQRRTESALTRAPRPGELATHLPPGEVDEIRIMATYLASHPDTPQLVLDPRRLPRTSCDSSPQARLVDRVPHIAAKSRPVRRRVGPRSRLSRRYQAVLLHLGEPRAEPAPARSARTAATAQRSRSGPRRRPSKLNSSP